MTFEIRRKDDHLCLHAICCTEESAKRWIENHNPNLTYDGGKKLTKDDFIITRKGGLPL